jgi:hypothetical protein
MGIVVWTGNPQLVRKGLESRVDSLPFHRLVSLNGRCYVYVVFCNPQKTQPRLHVLLFVLGILWVPFNSEEA